MYLFLLIPGFIGVVIGVFGGWIAGHAIESMRSARMSRATLVISIVFALSAWILFIGGLIYWHTAVEPRLDGSEGAGVGFGWVLLHLWGSTLTLLLSGFLFGYWVEIESRLEPKFRRDEQISSSNGG